MKTARFAKVVTTSGTPALHLLWVAANRDTTLKRALAEHRVMTLHQTGRRGGTDFGTVGLHQDKHSQILIFPRSLRRFADYRIVGINYALMANTEITEGSDTTTTDAPTRRTERKLHLAAPAKSHATPVAHSTPPPKPARRSAPLVAPLPIPAAPKPAPEPLTLQRALREVRRAVKELKADKPVAAYDRLNALLSK